MSIPACAANEISDFYRCSVCLINNKCLSCNGCESAVCTTGQCESRNNCVSCNYCNTRCQECQAICETNQLYYMACGNSFGARWAVSENGIIIEQMPRDRFYWAFHWIQDARLLGATLNSSISAYTIPTASNVLRASHWMGIQTALAALGVTANTEGFPVVYGNDEGTTAATKVGAGIFTTLRGLLNNLHVNRRACHFQNNRPPTCGFGSQCCQTCQGCMTCVVQADRTPVTNYYGTCISCNDCMVCVSCQGCVTCQQCNTCQECNVCNHPCVTAQTSIISAATP